MRFIFPLVIAGLAHVALAAPVRSSESAHSIVSRGTGKYRQATIYTAEINLGGIVLL